MLNTIYVSAKTNHNSSEIEVVLDSYLRCLDYDLNSADEAQAESYDSHPINAFHLMKRTSTLMPKIQNASLHIKEVCVPYMTG